MPRLHRPQPTPAISGVPSHTRNANRATKVAANLVTAAQRGPEMATAVEPELAGMGAGELRTVITELWMKLARKDNRDAV